LAEHKEISVANVSFKFYFYFKYVKTWLLVGPTIVANTRTCHIGVTGKALQ